MRIPHRNPLSLSLSHGFVALTTLTTFVVLLPMWAGAATQQLTCLPAGMSFRDVQLNQSQTRMVVLTNSGSTSVTISDINVRGSSFKVTGMTPPFVLAAGQSTGINVTFSPTASTWVQGEITLTSNATNSALKIWVEGSGVGKAELQARPGAVAFGQVPVGSSVSHSVVLTSTASGSQTVEGFQILSGTGFSVSGPKTPLVLPAGQSFTLTVKFSPRAAGLVSGNIAISGADLNVPLTATGMAPATTGQLAVSPPTLSLGSVVVGSSGTASGSLSASGASVTVTADSVNNSAFTISGLSLPVTLAAGQSVPFKVKFTPTAAGSDSATLAFTSNAQTSTTSEAVTGTGTSPVAQLAVSPTTLSLGSIVVGGSGTASGSLSASGASVTVTADSVNNSAFTVSGLTLPVTIPTGQSVPFTVKFTPTAAGSASATLAFTSNAQTSSTTESLTGTGTASPGQLAVSPSTLSFGSVNVGSTGTQATTLTASGASVTISSAAMSNSLFTLSGASFPMTLSAGQSQQIYVVFSPTAGGTDSGTMTLNSNATNAKISESMSGVGVTQQYSVSLSWNASTSSVVGYNIYRGATPGAYSKINTAVDPNTTYTDSTVTAGATYYYAATSVNTSGVESSYSTPIQVTIP
jgi:Abnormal spindle-like microcephaly-assoc'd, ASPM-SPD-2-Hydin